MAIAGWPMTLAGALGRWVMTKLRRPGELAGFAWVCLKAMGGGGSRGRRLLWRNFVSQLYFTAVQSFWIVLVLALLVGAVVVIQGYTQLSKVGGQFALTQLLIVVIIRELGPILTGLVIILRSGSAITIEMGYMTVLREMEGIEMLGIDPLRLLAVPRLAAMVLSSVMLLIVFVVVAVFGGFAGARMLANVSFWALWHDLAAGLSGWDLVVGLAKVMIFGLVTCVVCLYQGFTVRGAVTAIPPQVSRALLECFIYIFTANLVISVFFYL